MPVLLYRLIRLEAGADYRAIVRRPLFRPVWLSAHSFWNFFLLSEKKPWRRHPVWNESPCSTFMCEKLYSAYNSSHQRKAEKWAAILNGTMACEGMWLNVPIYCLCCQLGHKQFVPVFIWVFWRGGGVGGGVVSVCRRLLSAFFPIWISLCILIGVAHAKACMQGLGSGSDWHVREVGVISVSLSSGWRCRSHPAGLSAPTLHYSLS